MNTKILTTGANSLWTIKVFDGEHLLHFDKGEPNASMNECAYISLIQALDYVDKHAGNYSIIVENEIVREQTRGVFNCKADNLLPYRNKAQKMYETLKDRVRICEKWTKPKDHNWNIQAAAEFEKEDKLF